MAHLVVPLQPNYSNTPNRPDPRRCSSPLNKNLRNMLAKDKGSFETAAFVSMANEHKTPSSHPHHRKQVRHPEFDSPTSRSSTMRVSQLIFGAIALLPGVTLAQNQTVIVEAYPFEIVCNGSTSYSTSYK